MRKLALFAAMSGLGSLAWPTAYYTGAAAAARARNPKRGVVVGYAHQGGTFNAGRNKAKRRNRALVASLKGMPGWGWKRRLRQLQAAHRESGARQVPAHRSGGAA